MNALLRPEFLADVDPSSSAPAPIEATAQRYVWQSRFGTIVIEVQGGRTFVNGQLVEPAEPAPAIVPLVR